MDSGGRTVGLANAPAKFLVAVQLAALAACQTPTEHAVRTARHAELSVSVIQGTRYRHEIFAGRSTPGQTLFVFIDGDGVPWSRGGREPARDPTPHRPLALELAARTPRSVLYVGRPCYFSARSDPRCSALVWTSERYSAEVVESMAAVVNRYAALHAAGRVVLIGYSGGGALAILAAPRVPATRAVVTVAADLDVDAWAAWHHFLPLTGSLNPATQAPLDPAIQQWHLLGDRDLNVPASVSRRYLATVSPDRIWHFATFDHACCWAGHWSRIFPRLEAALGD
jgi:pimeloyl-ACP methyl ester carboxylesterase